MKEKQKGTKAVFSNLAKPVLQSCLSSFHTRIPAGRQMPQFHSKFWIISIPPKNYINSKPTFPMLLKDRFLTPGLSSQGTAHLTHYILHLLPLHMYPYVPGWCDSPSPGEEGSWTLRAGWDWLSSGSVWQITLHRIYYCCEPLSPEIS